MKFVEKPVISFISLLILILVLDIILEGVFKDIISHFLVNYSLFLTKLLSAIVIVALYVYIFKFKKIFSFSNFKTGIILVCPLILYIIVNFLDSNFMIPATVSSLLVAIFAGIVPGFAEEILYRGIIISYFMKLFKSSKGIFLILIFSSLIFGLIHLPNFFLSDSFNIILFQIFYAFAFGILTGAVYLRTGNLWPPIILHSLIDISSFFSIKFNLNSTLLKTNFVWNFPTILMFISCIIVIILGFYYVRISKHDEILELWEEKWIN